MVVQHREELVADEDLAVVSEPVGRQVDLPVMEVRQRELEVVAALGESVLDDHFHAHLPEGAALVVGTVYGGFHYAIDACAGAMVAVAGYLAGPWLARVCAREG